MTHSLSNRASKEYSKHAKVRCESIILSHQATKWERKTRCCSFHLLTPALRCQGVPHKTNGTQLFSLLVRIFTMALRLFKVALRYFFVNHRFPSHSATHRGAKNLPPPTVHLHPTSNKKINDTCCNEVIAFRVESKMNGVSVVTRGMCTRCGEVVLVDVTHIWSSFMSLLLLLSMMIIMMFFTESND